MKRPSLALPAALLLTLVVACGGGGADHAPPSKPSTTAPTSTQLAPIPPAIMARYAHDPHYRAILDAYNQQVQALQEGGQPFGADFAEVPAEVPAEASAGYMEGYFTYNAFYGNPSFMDGIQRPLIHSVADPGNVMSKVYEGLYQSGPPPLGLWDIPNVRRVAGYLYTGSKLAPATVAEKAGLWCNLFARGETAGSLPECVAQMENKKPLLNAFNLPSYLFHTENGGFVSLTRSVNVARYFALNVGYKGKYVDEGYVYVAQVSGGLDASHPSMKRKWVHHEQEVAIAGVVPWTRIVAYRRIVRNPGTEEHQAPPEFTGPIHVRSGLKDQDPQAYARILQDLSRKSLFTKDQEEGQDWKSKVALSRSDGYLDTFHKAHPKVDPADPSLW